MSTLSVRRRGAAPTGAGGRDMPPPGRAPARRRGTRRPAGHRAGTVLAVLLFLVLIAWTLIPIAWMLSSAFKSRADVLTVPPTYLPSPATLENFRTALTDGDLLRNIRNSLVVVTVSTPLSVGLAALAAYGLARFRFRFRGTLMFAILATRMLPPLIIALPMFLIFSRLGLLNNLLALSMVYVAFNLPFNIWLLHGFFAEIPLEIEESAALDGAGRWTTFSRVLLPLVAPALVATAIFSMILSWNEFAFALLLTSTTEAQTLPIAMAGLTSDRGTDFGGMGAIGSIAVLPLLAVAVYAQRFMTRGLTAGAVKG